MFRLLTLSIAIVLMAALVVVADNSDRSLKTSPLPSSNSQPILLKPIAIDGVPVSSTGPGPLIIGFA